MTFEELIAGSPPPAREIARDLLATARELLPGAVESGEGGDYGIGTAPGYKGLVFVITPVAGGVRLGIPGGASLDDPDGLLQGRGKVHRHVPLTDPEAARSPALRDLMRRAAERAR